MSMQYPIRRLGLQDRHHFFGYYNKSPWDREGLRILAQQVPWMDQALTPDLQAQIGYFDLNEGGKFKRVASTTAWNWQMGSQLQWLDGQPGRKLIFNTRSTQPGLVYPGLASQIVDIDSLTARELPLPVYVVSADSRWALSVNYRRLYVTHETIGYSEHGGPFAPEVCPADDGIRLMDLQSGEHRLVISYRELSAFHPVASMQRAVHWVSHIEVSPDSARVLFLHRWTERVKDETCFLHRLITMKPDGSDLRLLECSDHPLPQLSAAFDPNAVGTFDYEKSEYQISHPMWINPQEIVVWGPHAGRIHYQRYADAQGGPVTQIGPGVLTENGHMSFSPVNQRWLLSDTYPDDRTHERELFIYDMSTGQRHSLGQFYADPELGKENRCDLHPRWSRDGRMVCIDSVHEHQRQMYVIDVSALVD